MVITVLILLAFLTPVVMADEATGHVKVVDKNGNEVANVVPSSSGEKKIDDNKKTESNSSDIDDVWGIQQSNSGFSDLANINKLGSVYMGMTPFRNMSIISIAIAIGLAITFVIVGIFILLGLAGVGAAHPNIKKGWDLIRGAQGKIAAIGIVFALALFIIIVVFFSITIFGKIIVMMA
jgi:hypothetical protein